MSLGTGESGVMGLRDTTALAATPRRSALISTFSMSIATVIGPKPPGTGVIAPAVPSADS